MEQRECFRHELKYEITYLQYLELRNRLGQVMHLDPHAGPDSRYLIRSIYFDNFEDKALREKMNGIPGREKFRIRYYNDDLSYIALEKKRKDGYLCRKYHARITKQECIQLLKGGTGWMRGHPADLVRELYAKMQCQALRPKTLVSYVREPYLYGPGNVRVTFDSRIRTSLYHPIFLEREVADVSAQEAPQNRILEVKYDGFLPEIIRCLLQTDTIRQQAFSKYGASRRFM